VPQTVFDVGDLITSRLTLGVTPDGTTTATLVVTRPDGAVVTGIGTSGWTADQKTAQWYATDDGLVGGTKVHASGDWLAVWTVTGTGASVTAKVYSVRLLPSASEKRPVWTPFLSDVADYVPYLTVDTTTPGGQVYLGTFTGSTTPTDEQVQRILDREVSLLLTATVGISVMSAELYDTARTVAALRAATVLARTYPRQDNIDLRFATNLDAWAKAAFEQLVIAVSELGGGPGAGPAPVGYFPDAPDWQDLYL
jgi:hypothetical protein